MLTFYSFLFTFGCGIYMAIVQRVTIYWSIPEFRGIFAGILFVITIMCCFTEFCGIIEQILLWNISWNEDGIKVSNWIIKNTDEKSVFLSNREFLDPIVSLSGRSIFVTNDYLSARENINISQRKNDLFLFLQNINNQTSQVSKIVYYIAIWKNDHLLSKVNLPSYWKMVFKTEQVKIYKNIK